MIGKIKLTSSPMTAEAYREICNERRGDGRCAYVMEPEGCATCATGVGGRQAVIITYSPDGIYRDDPRDLADNQVRIGETVYTVKELPVGNGYFCEAEGCGDEEDMSTWVEAAYELDAGLLGTWRCATHFALLKSQEGEPQ